MSLCVLSNIVAHRLGFSSVEVTLYVEVCMLATCLTHCFSSTLSLDNFPPMRWYVAETSCFSYAYTWHAVT